MSSTSSLSLRFEEKQKTDTKKWSTLLPEAQTRFVSFRNKIVDGRTQKRQRRGGGSPSSV